MIGKRWPQISSSDYLVVLYLQIVAGFKAGNPYQAKLATASSV
jgi:hypothetical protein